MSVDSTGGAGKAIASAFIPGLGQFCDGRNKQGAAYLGASVAISAGSIALSRSLTKDMVVINDKIMRSGALKNADTLTKIGKEVTKGLSKATKAKWIALCALPIVALGVRIANIVDAYKGNRDKA